MKDLLSLMHPTTGVLAMLAALWVFVDTLNAAEKSEARIKNVSIFCAVLMWLTYLLGGYWYVVYYGADKAIIKAGPWPFGHNFFMEAKEHLFLALLLLATYLPVAANNLAKSKAARKVTLWVAGLIALVSLAMEGAGAVIGMAVRLALLEGVGG